MKTRFLVPLLSLFLFACSSDDDTTPPVNPFTGNWQMTVYEVENSYDFNGDGAANRNLVVETDCFQNEIITISANGNATSTSNSFLSVIGTLVQGTTNEYTYTTDCEMELDVVALTWTLNGSTLTFQEEDGFATTATLNSNNTELTFTVPNGFEIYTEGFNTLITEENLRVVFTK